VEFAKNFSREMAFEYKVGDKFHEIGLFPVQGRKSNAILEQALNQNSILCEHLMKQNMMLLEENKKIKETVVTNNIVENHTNKTFNIQVFLNEECKGAVNLTDFIRAIQIEEADLMYAKERGFVESVTHIFEKGLQQYDIHTRPLHCTDMKRETVHVREGDGWVKDAGGNDSRIKRAISTISNKKMNRLCTFLKEHPEYSDVQSPKYEEYLRFMRSVIGGADQEQERNEKAVLKNIVKSIYIAGNHNPSLL
jgi:hypothetical protein